MTGNAEVVYMLDGMPEIYRYLVYIPQTDSIDDLASVIDVALITKRNGARVYM